jgi:hypothetical protein
MLLWRRRKLCMPSTEDFYLSSTQFLTNRYGSGSWFSFLSKINFKTLSLTPIVLVLHVWGKPPWVTGRTVRIKGCLWVSQKQATEPHFLFLSRSPGEQNYSPQRVAQ